MQMEHNFRLPQPVQTALCRLEQAGYEAFIVGGCVRDCLLGKEPQDYDITTSALPEETKAVFAGERLIESGLKHGTVTVLLDRVPLEITTYRVESAYSDNRHPDAVSFTRNLREDTARRDFTMNAMAYSESCGLVDYHGGQEDLRAGRIRCVGNPGQRFREDALRILRALRFASVLNFEIEDETAQAIREEAWRLQNISRERIREELLKLLCGEGVRRILLDYVDVLGVVIPEILPMKGFDQKNIHHIYDVWTHTAVAVDSIPRDPILRISALLHDIGKPDCFTVDEKGVGHFYGHGRRSEELAEEILTRLKFDNAAKKQILQLVLYHDLYIEDAPQPVKRALNRFTPEGLRQLVLLKRADNLAQNPQFRDRQQFLDRLEAVAAAILEEEQCFCLRDLAVNGRDLIEMGMEPGESIGNVLNTLLEAVIGGQTKNEKEALLTWAKEQKLV